jgi:hypothetical protein
VGLGVRKLIASVAALALLAPSPAQAAVSQDVPFAQAVFAATHNSYSGNLADGERGSITQQLDFGVRFLEFDVWDKLDNGQRGYFLGHSGPGNDVDKTGGNPPTTLLVDWLVVVAGWSDGHHGHAPITVALDMKDDITDDNYSFAQANPAALNKTLTDVFGDKLLMAGVRDYDTNPLPNVSQLRDKVIVVLSGNQHTRTLYRRDAAAEPAVAMNSAGRVVEVHQSNTADYLWYWTGRYGPDGTVQWDRHTRYDTGRTPAVAVDASGTVVEVHKSQNNSNLYYHVGKLGADNEIVWGPSVQYDTGATPAVALNDNGDVVEVHSAGSNTGLWSRVGKVSGTQITWGPSRKYDTGQTPSVAFTSPSTVREVHGDVPGQPEQHWTRTGTVDATGPAITWSVAARTDLPFYKTKASIGSQSVRVWTGADGGAPATTLRYTTDRLPAGRVQYQQVAFVEYQAGDGGLAEIKTNSVFWASTAADTTFLREALAAGKSVRGWDFDSSVAGEPFPRLPATNHPFEPWYQTDLTGHGYVEY